MSTFSSPSLSHSPSVMSNALTAVKSIIQSCITALSQAITISVESVSAFASRCRSGMANAGINIDQIVIYIKELEIYSLELLERYQEIVTRLGRQAFFEHIYDLESKLYAIMRDFSYIRQTMERVILGIIQTLKRVLRSLTLASG